MLFDSKFDFTTTAVKPMEVNADLHLEVSSFLYREARLLDTRDFDQWLQLWTSDGMYWIPHQEQQSNPKDHISLFWEDATLREVRVRRITNARNWSQQPHTRTARSVTNISIDGTDEEGRLVVRSTLLVSEWRNTQRILAGLVTHKLVKTQDDAWKIYLKRADLTNSTDVLANLEVFL